MIKRLLSLLGIRNKSVTEKEIHLEFENCSRYFLANAKSDTDLSISEIDFARLPSVGAKIINGVVENLRGRFGLVSKKVFMTVKETKDMLAYYAQGYPSNSFVTNKMISDLCKKHNLVCRFIANYRGYMDDQNILAKDFFCHPHEDDLLHFYEIYNVVYQTTRTYNKQEFLALYPSGFVSESDGVCNIKQVSVYGRSREYLSIKFPNGQYVISDDFTAFTAGEMLICAPEGDFASENGSPKAYNARLKENRMSDPVILFPVKNGALVVNMVSDRIGEFEAAIQHSPKNSL